jgi:hypothetical protein
MSAKAENWQLMCPDGIFETDLETLQEWIREGRVQRDDKVCKGNLNWIEAYRAPMLRRVFDGEPAVAKPQPGSTQEAPSSAIETIAHNHQTSGWQEQQSWNTGKSLGAPRPDISGICHFHPDAEASDVCRSCAGLFCGACTKKIGGGVIVCPLCGDMCKPLHEVRRQAAFYEYRDSGFGVSDLGESLAYPFKHVVALIVGAIIYGVLLLGGFKTQVIGWALLFGCISQTINQIAVGRKDRDFMPDFSSFSLWDDLIRPALLGIGITMVTVGPTILLGIMMFWQVSQSAVVNPESTRNSQASSMITSEDMDELVQSRDEKKSEEIAKKIQSLQQQSRMDSPIGSLEEKQVSPFSMMLDVLNIPKWMMLAMVLSVLWAVFYYPMALAVAGYTESFGSTVNPLFGLDAMRRMGATYAKAFLMYLVVEVVGVGIMFIVGIITAPFNMPMVGNLPATFISGIITFYTSLVLACILGLALFKSADRLGIHTN